MDLVWHLLQLIGSPMTSFLRDLGDGYRIPSWPKSLHHGCALAHTHVFL